MMKKSVRIAAIALCLLLTAGCTSQEVWPAAVGVTLGLVLGALLGLAALAAMLGPLL